MNLVIVQTDVVHSDVEAVSIDRFIENLSPEWKSDSTVIELSMLKDEKATTHGGLYLSFVQAKKLGLADGGFLLVRPDGYLAAAGNLSCPEPLLRWCDSVSIKAMQTV